MWAPVGEPVCLHLEAYTYRQTCSCIQTHAEEAIVDRLFWFAVMLDLNKLADRFTASFCCLFYKQRKLSVSLSERVDLGEDFDRRYFLLVSGSSQMQTGGCSINIKLSHFQTLTRLLEKLQDRRRFGSETSRPKPLYVFFFCLLN